MLENWLDNTRSSEDYSFEVINISEKKSPEEIMDFLGRQVFQSYRPGNQKILKDKLEDKNSDHLDKYLKEQVFPRDNKFKVGDFGEILSAICIEVFEEDLEIPLKKLKLKLNNNTSVRGIDIFAHNEVAGVLRFCEVKTKTGFPRNNNLGVTAHDELAQSNQIGVTETIADFLKGKYEQLAENAELRGNQEDQRLFYKKASYFGDIVLNPERFERQFSVILVLEEDLFDEKLCTNLEKVASKLSPLSMTVILIKDLNSLISNSFDAARAYIHQVIYSNDE